MKNLIYGDIERWISDKKIMRVLSVAPNSYFDVIIPEMMIVRRMINAVYMIHETKAS